MEEKGYFRNISGTICVIGLAISSFNQNSTMLIDGNYRVQEMDCSFSGFGDSSSYQNAVVKNIYLDDESVTKLESEAQMLFGIMREATPEEQKGVNEYIMSISKDTGVNFFDLC